MIQHEQYRVVAASPLKPDDVVLIDSRGEYRLFIGSTGSISRGTLNPGFVDALLEREHWGRVASDRAVTVAELQSAASTENEQSSVWRWVQDYLNARAAR